MYQTLKKIAAGLAVALPVLMISPAALAAASTVVVSPSNHQGWLLNPDPSNQTPYEFNKDQASIGQGSLYVQPIGATPADKFIMAKTLNSLVSDFNSLSYDFLIAGNGTAASANQFYLNVYTNLPASTTYYDCRFDYAPTSGSTSSFTTASFSSTATPVNVRARSSVTCPATLAGMPAGSTISFIALNVGDTTVSDTGLAGYLDKVVINTTSAVTTYDFEPDPVVLHSKDECKNGGWKTSEAPVFKNQGDCVSYFASNGKAKGNPVVNFLLSLI